MLPSRPRVVPATSRSVLPRPAAHNPYHGKPYCDHDWPYNNPWDLAVATGSWLFCMMNAPLGVFSSSKLLNYGDLRSWGWDIGSNVEVNPGLYNMEDAWHDLGISRDRSSWTSVFAEHSFETLYEIPKEGRRTYPNTDAAYDNLFNLSDGAILAESNFSPDYENIRQERDIPANQIIPLKRWSDVVWLIWQRLHTDSDTERDVGNLQHVFRFSVTNADARARMRGVLSRQSLSMYGPPPKWPGLRFSIHDDMAKVLMSTSNGAGVTWLLTQHKRQLGVKVVDELRMFSCEGSDGWNWNLYFHVVDEPLGPGEV